MNIYQDSCNTKKIISKRKFGKFVEFTLSVPRGRDICKKNGFFEKYIGKIEDKCKYTK